jgi:hypothetical protein
MFSLPKTAIASLVIFAVMAAAPDAEGQSSSPEVGDTVTYKFRSAPMNAMGITSLEDLRGKPVLVEFWGTR